LIDIDMSAILSQSMKNLIMILALVITVAAMTLFVFVFVMPSMATIPAVSGTLVNIESYVSENISELSPMKEVLGGTFYVTSVEAADGKGIVNYEDGHVAYTADFVYEVSDESGILITSFIIRQ